MDRRQFLLGISTPALAAGLSSCSAPPQALPKGSKIAIIGAGLSGLSCANSLYGRGYQLSIFEGRSRPGGRVHSSSHELFRSCELGASYLHGGAENPLRQLCHQWNIPLRPYHHTKVEIVSAQERLNLFEQRETWETFDVELDDEAMVDFLRMWVRKTLRLPLETRTMGQSLKRYFSKTQIPLLQDKRVQSYVYDLASQLFGAHPDKVSWTNFLTEPRVDGVGYGPFAEDEAMVEGGLVQLIHKLAQDQNIQYDTSIKLIEQKGQKILLKGPNINEEFDACVVTVPLGVLKANHLEIKAQLPDSWTESLSKLEMGHVQKIHMDLSKKLLEKKMSGLYFSRPEFSLFGINYYHYNLRQIFSAFLTGETAVDFEKRDDAQIQLYFKKYFHHFHSRSDFLVNEIECSRWSQDPLSKGAYSYLGLQARGDEHQVFSKDLHPQIIMAGEHTHPTDPGTMHGAYWSGMRAAQQILGES